MSEYSQDDSSSPHHDSDTNLSNLSLKDTANSSIIGKVKSRVSSILPNRLSKWFSQTPKLRNDPLNGSISSTNTTLPLVRRRRHIEIEEESYGDDVVPSGSVMFSNQDRNQDSYDENENDEEDDESQISNEECIESCLRKQTTQDLNIEQQPPAKRLRLNIDFRESPLITRRQPLLSSTPSSGSSYLRGSSATVSGSSYQRYTNLNIYGNENKEEPAFNFGQQKESKIYNINTNIIDLVSNPTSEEEDKLSHYNNAHSDSHTGISSRKILNIPSSTSINLGAERAYATVAQLKRQPLSSAKIELPTTTTKGVPPRRTSTTIQEIQDLEDQEEYEGGVEKEEKELFATKANAYNGLVEGSNNDFLTTKRQKLINGTPLNTRKIPESNDAIVIDSASESGDSGLDVIKAASSNTQHRKSGLFNLTSTAAANTRNSSRTSSFGNSLNFYSHLEGRKSLFSGPNRNISNPLNNSTLSLTSLNRRQFNASIYGSTSALSDSRLLNTFSPFYKGKTTYGGAAAYNKYAAGAGASAVRITPTLIRPTSSLSSLSSSNSLGNNVNSQFSDNSTISSTAKRILDLINDFATPLSEAKKMANSLKTNSNLQIPPQAKGRLNDSDLIAARALRLSQVCTPYSRPTVILQPSGNASGRGAVGGPLPPIKELQVPTMSQLLQMKRIQNTTEKARKIAQNSVENIEISEYSLPDAAAVNSNVSNAVDKEQQKHTNKIRNKVTNSLRSSTALKDLKDEEPPPPVNLPNIAFPLMQSVPKIDIQLNKTSAANNTASEIKTTLSTSNKESSTTVKIVASNSDPFLSNTTSNKSSTQTTSSTADCITTILNNSESTSTLSYKTINNFIFSEPLQIGGITLSTQNVTTNDINKYKFSPPMNVALPTSVTDKIHNIHKKQPQLKEGSCLDALSKPFSHPTVSKTNTSRISSNTSPTSAYGFGNQFKLSSNEWECCVCMTRNKSDVNKCVACESQRQQNLTKLQQSNSPTEASNAKLSLGQLFKKSMDEWECDTCLIRNKQNSAKCIACETTRKDTLPPPATHINPVKNSFGDAFKPKPGTWQCQTCMVSNKKEETVCIACQTKRSGSDISSRGVVAVPETKLNSADVANKNAIASTLDSGFKSLAAEQKASKWECDACMTRNDVNRTKCACCEQPKPGTSTDCANAPSNKFQFGTAAAANFSFGFGTGLNVPKEDELRKNLSQTNEASSSILGLAASQSETAKGDFQLGIKPTASKTVESKKDETEGNKNLAGFKFGTSSENAGKIIETPPAVSTFTFGLKPATGITSTPLSSSATAVSTSSLTCLQSSANSDKPTGVATTFNFGNTATTSTSGGFTFGNNIASKEVKSTQENKQQENFTFKAPATVLTTTPKNTGFVFGSSPLIISSPLTTVSNTNNAASSTSTAATTATTTTTTAVAAAATAITTPPTTIIATTTLATTTISAATTTTTAATTAPTITTAATTTATITATTISSAATATIKPMFSFAVSTPDVKTQNATTFTGSSLGNNFTKTSTDSTLFTPVTSTSTTITAANTTTSLSTLATNITPASTNIFGSFGGGGGSTNTSATPIFGSSINSPANNNSTTVSSSTNSSPTVNATQFGVFGSKTMSNVFGSFGGSGSAVGVSSSSSIKPIESKQILPVFGNVAASNTSQSSRSNSVDFIFSSNSSNNSTLVATTSSTGSVTSTTTTWPKNSFVFGSTAAATSPNFTVATPNITENKEVAKPSVFSAFSSPGNNPTTQQQTSSIFGASVINNSAPTSTSSIVTAGVTNASKNLFSTNAAPAVTSIFGANSSGNAATPAPAFGSSPFGGAAPSASATPTFGSTAASSSATFGGFGITSNTTTNPSEIKKPETAFNLGAAVGTQSTSGGFNFGSSTSTTKSAFNFGGTATTQQPTFNFTGKTESQNSTKPFQFGATPSAPVFNFTRGALEGTPNAPFQFNAGAAPVSSNIFAPTPISGAQNAQQAKRKIRAPIRRVTQR